MEFKLYQYSRRVRTTYDNLLKGERFMFHFTDKEGLNGILKSKSLWLTNTKDLNDFSERIYETFYLRVYYMM